MLLLLLPENLVPAVAVAAAVAARRKRTRWRKTSFDCDFRSRTVVGLRREL